MNFSKLVILSLLSLTLCQFLHDQDSYTPLTKEHNDEIEQIFNEFILNTEYSSNTFFPEEDLESSVMCKTCTVAVNALRNVFLKKYGVQGFYKFCGLICSKFIDDDICKGAIAHYGDIVLDNLIKRGLDSERLCKALKLCNNSIPYISIDDYALRVLRDKPQPVYEKVNATAPTLKAVQVTDTHLDMNYEEGTVVDCGRPLCCRKGVGKMTNTSKLAGLYGSIGNCDANIEIVKAFAEKTKELNPDFILFTGDNIAHSVWEVTQEEVIKATKMQIDAIVKETGDIPIYPAIGNHEKAPVDEFYGEEKELLEGLAEIFKPFLTQEAYETFKKYGYYTQLHKNTNLRIVSLNCIMCDSFNWYLINDHSQPKKMYEWLEGVLRAAEMHNEGVYILDHISIGNSQHTMQCGKRLKILMDRFQNTIKGYISGHSHNEQIRLVTEYNGNRTVQINHIASGLTTYSEYNPSFRMYLIDSSTNILKDFIQYRFDLDQSNKIRKPIWYESYNATTFFNVTYLNDFEGLSHINIPGDYIVKKYTDTEAGKQKAYDEKTILYATCDYKYDLLEEQMKCKKIKKGFNGDYMHYVLNLLMGEWREDK